MGHHKRGRAKNRRAGCLLCKPEKANGLKGSEAHQTWQERKSRISEREQITTYLCRNDLYAAWEEDESCNGLDCCYWQDAFDCECADCDWRDNLAASKAYVAGPLVAPLQLHQTYKASRN